MSSGGLSQAIAEASGRAEVRTEILRIYGLLQEEIDRRQPVCQASGRCCRFEEYGHRLFVTTLELAVFAADLREVEPVKPVASPRGLPVLGQLTTGCVYQIDGLCSVHLIRPFGCRIFFCDPSAEAWQQAQYEHFHGLLKRAHETLNVPYYYVEWRAGLAAIDSLHSSSSSSNDRSTTASRNLPR